MADSLLDWRHATPRGGTETFSFFFLFYYFASAWGGNFGHSRTNHAVYAANELELVHNSKHMRRRSNGRPIEYYNRLCFGLHAETGFVSQLKSHYIIRQIL